MGTTAGTPGISVRGARVERQEEVLTPDALGFLAELHRRFGARRQELLTRRQERRAEVARTGRLDFLSETREIREDASWRVAPAPADLTNRRVEITGPTERRMLVNAMNSGAQVWLADFEDANSPTWANMVGGQLNLTDAIERRIDFTTPEGKRYVLGDAVATIVARPRGWHLDEHHLEVALRYQHVMAGRDQAIAAALDELVQAAATSRRSAPPRGLSS